MASHPVTAAYFIWFCSFLVESSPMHWSRMRSTNLQMHKKSKFPVILIGIGCIIYAIMVRYTNFRIPCFFHKITGYYCPGCGITRMFYHLTFLDWKRASQENYFLFWSIPLLLGLFLVYYFPFSKFEKNRRRKKLINITAIGYLIGLVIWSVVRNILSI